MPPVFSAIPSLLAKASRCCDDGFGVLCTHRRLERAACSGQVSRVAWEMAGSTTGSEARRPSPPLADGLS